VSVSNQALSTKRPIGFESLATHVISASIFFAKVSKPFNEEEL
jgi:hypothetical protein